MANVFDMDDLGELVGSVVRLRPAVIADEPAQSAIRRTDAVRGSASAG